MKGDVLALLCFGAPLPAFSQRATTDFEFGAIPSSMKDLGRVLRPALTTNIASAEIVTDNRSEVRGSRPSVAYTVFRLDLQNADASLQPIFGRINGAQIKVTW